MIVVGVDPGTQATGYGVVAARGGGAFSLLECGVIRTASSAPLAQRVRVIYEGTCQILDRYQPHSISVERVFQGKNVHSALTLGHARGVVLLAAALRDIGIAEYAPREIKKAVVGFGGAGKDQVAFMVQRMLRLKSPPTPSDAADGVAAALCHHLCGGVTALASGGAS
ncbi:MAG: crossover junction endodeoxyribonuclease RuvC [Gemmatimonadota bacterium]